MTSNHGRSRISRSQTTRRYTPPSAAPISAASRSFAWPRSSKYRCNWSVVATMSPVVSAESASTATVGTSAHSRFAESSATSPAIGICNFEAGWPGVMGCPQNMRARLPTKPPRYWLGLLRSKKERAAGFADTDMAPPYTAAKWSTSPLYQACQVSMSANGSPQCAGGHAVFPDGGSGMVILSVRRRGRGAAATGNES